MRAWDVVVKIFRANDERDFVAHFRLIAAGYRDRPLGFNAAGRLAIEQLAHRSRGSGRRGAICGRPWPRVCDSVKEATVRPSSPTGAD